MKGALALMLLAGATWGAGWEEYRSGPFRVLSNAGDRAARERLNEMEQIRWALGTLIGKDAGKVDLNSVWPITLVLYPNAKEYGPHALKEPLVDSGTGLVSAWMADTAQPVDWKRELTRRLLEDNAQRMPASIERGLLDLFSTIQVNGTHILLGAPPPSPSRDWIKVQYLATTEELAGRFRIYLNNLQQGGDEDLASRNALNVPPAELAKRIEEYSKAGKFQTASVPGRPLNPNRDFLEKQVPEATVQALFAELKNFAPESPRGLLAKNTQASLALAATANPKWAEPHYRLALLETNPVARVKELKTAATLAPRNSSYWQALAEAQVLADQYDDAVKSWGAAERAAATPEEKDKLREARRNLEEKRTEFDIADRRRQADEREKELQRLKDAAAAEVHAAEDAANRAQGGLKSGAKPIEWWADAKGEPVTGMLTRVDCQTGQLKLTIAKTGGGNAILAVRDPKNLAVRGASQVAFVCGVQRPTLKIALEHNGKPDAKLGTAGDVIVVEFP